MTTWLKRAVVAAAILTAPDAYGQDLFFLTPRPGSCTGDGIRQFSAIIDGRNFFGDWVQACRVTQAEINGQRFPSHDCGWNGGRVWGHFDVPDATCTVSLFFLAPVAGACQADGRREFSAVIDGTNFTGDWLDACRQTTATILSTTVPSRDCAWVTGRVWGKFDVPDASCRMRVRGKVQYRDFDGIYTETAAGRAMTPRNLHPVRRGLVEIWYGSGAGRTKQVVNTAEDGTFDTFVPTFPASNYRAIVVASNPAGQANLRDNSSTWFWTPDFTLDTHADGDGLFLKGDIEKPDEAQQFNAADALLVAYDYAIKNAIPASRINRVAIMPQSASSPTAHTTPSGAWSVLRIPVDTSNMNLMFDDGTIIHEFAHHLQRMNDTYALWPSNHNGCSVTVGLHNSNSAEFAWFEGFPEYYRVAAGRSNPGVVTDPSKWASHAPAGAKRAPKGTPPCPAAEIPPSGAASVEDYVASLLLDLVGETGIMSSGGRSGAFPLSRAQLERRLLDIWFKDTASVRPPGNGMPRIGDFQIIWNRAFPNSSALNTLMTAYGM